MPRYPVLVAQLDGDKLSYNVKVLQGIGPAQ
jgi:hypothetical protein